LRPAAGQVVEVPVEGREADREIVLRQRLPLAGQEVWGQHVQDRASRGLRLG
jgi:hypothetical protein